MQPGSQTAVQPGHQLLLGHHLDILPAKAPLRIYIYNRVHRKYVSVSIIHREYILRFFSFFAISMDNLNVVLITNAYHFCKAKTISNGAYHFCPYA